MEENSMFENIHFINTTYTIPVTDTNYLFTVAKYYDDSEHMLELMKEELTGSFLINGEIRLLIPHMVSDFAKERLFYITNFGLLSNQKGYYTKREQMESYLLSVTYEGCGYLEYEGRSYEILPGQCFLIDGKKPHLYRTQGDRWVHADLHFFGAFSDKIIQEFNENEEFVLPWTDESCLQQQLESLLNVYDNTLPYKELLVSNQLETMLLSLLKLSNTWHRAYKGIPDNLQDVIRYMELHYMDHLNLDFLADFAGINKYHMIRLFNKWLGISPKDYIINLQLNAAKSLLKSTSLPANKIGVMVGLDNENYFRHLFKARVGMSPGNYRRQ